MKKKELFEYAKWKYKGFYYDRKPPKIKREDMVEIGWHTKNCNCRLFEGHDGRRLNMNERAIYCAFAFSAGLKG